MKHTFRIIGSAALALALIACGGDDDDDTTDDTTVEVDDETTTPDDTDASDEESTDEATTEDDTADEATTVDAEVTAPGTQLAVGDSAVVPYGDSADGLVEITVTAIEPGDRAAFDAAFGDKAEGIDPFYIRYSVEVISVAADDTPEVPALRGTAPDGGPTGTVIVGSVPDCEQERFGSDAAVGDVVETCRLQAAVAGEQVGGAEFDDHDDYSDSPVLWTA